MLRWFANLSTFHKLSFAFATVLVVLAAGNVVRKQVEEMIRLSVDPSEDVRNTASDYGTGQVAPAQAALVSVMDSMMTQGAEEAHAASTSAVESYNQASRIVFGVLAAGA